VPPIPLPLEEIENLSDNYILYLIPPFHLNNNSLSIKSLRDIFGLNPKNADSVCFYNQDWYIKESFFLKSNSHYKWNLVEKDVSDTSLGRTNFDLINNLNYKLPSALDLTFLFFTYYSLFKEILWSYNFIWTSDKDSNNDSIYVGRYFDPNGIAKDGFSIHRHLSITKVYGGINSLLL